jgi:methionyl-tRNA synthetase
VASFYLTTAIDYANGDPHFGHALEKIGADAIARYRRLRGDDVHFLMGMDEHGQKNAQAAAERGVSPQEYVDEMSARFAAMWKRLEISNDQWIRTTDPAHRRGVQHLISLIKERNPGDFFEQTYEGWYCVGCEQFKRPAEIVDGRCVLHPTRTMEWTQERNWFFRLSRYQEFLQRLFADQPSFLRPESRRNEMLMLLDQGLEDISITRSRLTWAIPFPIPSSTGEQQGTWVWFDALPNYLTATGFPDPAYTKRWPAQLHIVGKDITRLHAIIWPAMLKAAELELPREVWGHGFIGFGGERFSKSSGVKADLGDAIDRFGVDAFRYFLLREVPFDSDGSFSWERFEERYVSELANAFGNLASRTLSMIEKYRGGSIPAGGRTALDRGDTDDLGSYHAAMDGSQGYLLHDALRAVMAMIGRGNEFVQSSQPWALAKQVESAQQLDDVLASLARQLARVAVCLHPFMPSKAAELWRQLGGPGDIADQRFNRLESLEVTGWQASKGDGLFPREP